MKTRRTISARSRRPIRSCLGVTGVIEIIASALFLVVLGLLGLDICMAIFGAYMNDHACRDATRAASGANSKDKAWTLAQATLNLYHPDGYFISQPALVADQFEYNDYNSAPAPDTSPYVTVTTHCVVRIPAPIFFYGATFMRDGKAEFTQQYTFPIVQSRFVKKMTG